MCQRRIFMKLVRLEGRRIDPGQHLAGLGKAHDAEGRGDAVAENARQIKVGDVAGVALGATALVEDVPRHRGEQLGAVLQFGKLAVVAVQGDMHPATVGGLDDGLYVVEGVGGLGLWRGRPAHRP